MLAYFSGRAVHRMQLIKKIECQLADVVRMRRHRKIFLTNLFERLGTIGIGMPGAGIFIVAGVSRSTIRPSRKPRRDNKNIVQAHAAMISCSTMPPATKMSARLGSPLMT